MSFGNAGGFGSNTGSGFGSNTSGFGAANNNQFRTATSGFGGLQTNGGFGATPSGFGAQNTAQTASSGFGSNTSGFGGNTSLFGRQNNAGATGFGSSTGGFGATANSGTGFGSNSTIGFNSNPTGFGATGTVGFGAGSSQAIMPATNSNVNNGTGAPKYAPIRDETSQFIMTAISAMPAYTAWSFEELRLADYTANRKFNTAKPASGGFGVTNTASTGFGTAPNATGFGGLGTSTSNTAGGFGSSSTGGFGGTSSWNNTQSNTSGFGGGFGSSTGGGFGSTNTAAGFGTSSATPAFGQTNANATAPSGFGSGAFGSANAAGGFRGTSSLGFGSNAANNPTSTSSSLFGGGFGSNTNTGFGANASTAVAPTQNSTFGGQTSLFGQPQQPAASTGFNFGSTAGSTTGSTGFSFGASTAPAAGTAPGMGNTGSVFGTASTGSGLMGGGFNAATTAQPTPAFGAPAPTSNAFGNATGGFSFGQTSQTQPQQTSGFGGIGQQPKITNFFGGPTTTNANSTTPAFSFGAPSASTGGGLFGSGTTNAPATTTAATSNSLFSFGQTATKPQITSFGFNAPSTTATLGGNTGLGASAVGGFGAPAQTTSSLVGGFGGGGTSLFGGSTGAPSMQPTVATGAVKVATIDGSPYGYLPAFKSKLTKVSSSKEELFKPYNSDGKIARTGVPWVASLDRSDRTFSTSPLSVSRPIRGFSGRGSRSTANASSVNDSTKLLEKLKNRQSSRQLEIWDEESTANARLKPFTSTNKDNAVPQLTPATKSYSHTPSVSKTPQPPATTTASSINNSILHSSPERHLNDSNPFAATTVNTPAAADITKSSVAPFTDVENDSFANAGASEYWTEPEMGELMELSKEQLSSVSNFQVGLEGYGSVKFLQPVDLWSVGCSLDPHHALDGIRRIPGKIVTFAKYVIIVYGDDSFKPPKGQGLNVPAEISLENCFARKLVNGEKQIDTDEQSPFVVKHIRKLKLKPRTSFQHFDAKTGVWTFRVEHFSRYGLFVDESDDEVADLPPDKGEADGGGAVALSNASLLKQKTTNLPSALKSVMRIKGTPSVYSVRFTPQDVHPKGQGPIQSTRANIVNGADITMLSQELEESSTFGVALKAKDNFLDKSDKDLSVEEHLATSDDGSDAVQSERLKEPRERQPKGLKRPNDSDDRVCAKKALDSTSDTVVQATAVSQSNVNAEFTFQTLLKPPTRAIPKRILRRVLPPVASVSSGPFKDIIGRRELRGDAGLVMGPTFRVSWARVSDGWTLVTPASRGSMTELSLRRFVSDANDKMAESGSAHLLRWIAEKTLGKSKCDGFFGVREAFRERVLCNEVTLSMLVQSIRDNKEWASCLSESEFQFLELAAILLDPVLAHEEIRRRQLISEWVKRHIASIVDLELSGGDLNPLERAFKLLCSRRVCKAAIEAREGRYLHLACVIAQVTGTGVSDLAGGLYDGCVVEPAAFDTSFAEQQLECWRQDFDGMSPGNFIDADQLRIWALLAGNVDEWKKRELTRGLGNWKRAFGLVLWYCRGGRCTLEEAVKLLREFPLAANQRDPALKLLYASIEGGALLDSSLRLLHSSMGFVVSLFNVNGAIAVDSDLLLKRHVDRCQFVGMWQEALGFCRFFRSEALAKSVAMEILTRNLPYNELPPWTVANTLFKEGHIKDGLLLSSTLTLAVSKLNVPVDWINETRCFGARYAQDVLLEVACLLDLKRWRDAVELCMQQVAPAALLVGDFELLLLLLQSVPAAILAEDFGGAQLVYDFCDLICQIFKDCNQCMEYEDTAESRFKHLWPFKSVALYGTDLLQPSVAQMSQLDFLVEPSMAPILKQWKAECQRILSEIDARPLFAGTKAAGGQTLMKEDLYSLFDVKVNESRRKFTWTPRPYSSNCLTAICCKAVRCRLDSLVNYLDYLVSFGKGGWNAS